MTATAHIVEIGDPRLDEAWCKGCSFRFYSNERSKLRAAAFRHVADILDPPKETD